jgi:hypothetical protein
MPRFQKDFGRTSAIFHDPEEQVVVMLRAQASLREAWGVGAGRRGDAAVGRRDLA